MKLELIKEEQLDGTIYCIIYADGTPVYQTHSTINGRPSNPDIIHALEMFEYIKNRIKSGEYPKKEIIESHEIQLITPNKH